MDQRPRAITIAGIDRTLNLMAKSLNITDKIPGKSTCSFELFDTTGLLTLQGRPRSNNRGWHKSDIWRRDTEIPTTREIGCKLLQRGMRGL